MRTLLLTTSIVMAGAAAPALAQGQSGDAAGFCTADYMPAPRGAEGVAGTDSASEFAEMDTDGDGMVSQSEYIACREAAAVESDRSAENMAEADTDADQQLTREEFLAAAAQAHGAIAASSDPGPDMVTVFRRYILVPAAEPATDPAAMSEDDVATSSGQQFDALDADQDYLISVEEWQDTSAMIERRTEALVEGFGDLDTDSSGDLTEEEYADGTMPEEDGGGSS